MKVTFEMTEKTQYVEVSKIEPNPYQTRITYDQKSMDELKQSIKQLGIVTPLLLRPFKERFQLISGSRRLKAAQELGLKEVPAIVKELMDKEVMEITITENLQREDLNPIEEALGFKRLLEEFDYTHEKLGERLGKSRAYITNSLRLLKLDLTVQGDVLRKTFTAWHARCLLPLPGDVQFHFANLIWDWNWSVRETKVNVKRFLDGEEWLEWERKIPIDAISTERPIRLYVMESDFSQDSYALTLSIKQQGLFNPISVLVTGQLLDGHRRLAACKKLGWKLIPSKIIFWCEWIKGKGKVVLVTKKTEKLCSPILDKMEEMGIKV